ncbi:MAG: fused response regulator/phosphatase [Rhodospirillales bacterium]|nr:fused response regulator/phosphatase [Rhodospirillales bacterium]
MARLDGSRVLVVEDSPRNRQIIGAYLEAMGIKDLVFAEDGEEGLRLARELRPDLIVLDIMMPRMDGFEVLRHLRADPDIGDTPVLVETALEAAEERSRVFAEGATDMVTKPINGAELMARTRIHLENRHLISSLRAYRKRLDHELGSARRMQLGLMPPPKLMKALGERYDVILDGYFETSSELGGDLWGVQEIDENRFGLFLVDFSGHGVSAALNAFRLHTLMGEIHPDPADPAAYLSRLNIRLKELIPRGQFATMLYLVLDAMTDTIIYTAAAAPRPLLGRFGAPGVTACEASGTPLGISENAVYENRVIKFARGDFLFLYSDALIESPDRDGRALGQDGAVDLLRRHVIPNVGESPLTPMIGEFSAGLPGQVPDDLTAVWLCRPRG